MVNARTYPLWRDLAMSEDLPQEALRGRFLPMFHPVMGV
jgi:hypothetical protein